MALVAHDGCMATQKQYSTAAPPAEIDVSDDKSVLDQQAVNVQNFVWGIITSNFQVMMVTSRISNNRTFIAY
jgi:hypothetical protein